MHTRLECPAETDGGLGDFDVIESSRLCTASIALNPSLERRANELHRSLAKSLKSVRDSQNGSRWRETADSLHTELNRLEECSGSIAGKSLLLIANAGRPTIDLVRHFLTDIGPVSAEDCSFVRNYIEPYGTCHAKSRLSIVTPHTIWVKTRGSHAPYGSSPPELLLTIQDRWASKHSELDVVCDIGTAKFYISPIDALLTLLHPRAYVLRGATLESLPCNNQEAHPEIPFATVRKRTILLLDSLYTMIDKMPDEYFGSSALISRSLRWRNQEAHEHREIIAAVLRYSLTRSGLVKPGLAADIRRLCRDLSGPSP